MHLPAVTLHVMFKKSIFILVLFGYGMLHAQSLQEVEAELAELGQKTILLKTE